MADNQFDVIIVGAGPGGLMAATAIKNKSVLILEKNLNPGKKLLITGKGRCNITNAERDFKVFANTFGKKGKFLYSSMSRFTVDQTIDFFETRGLRVKTERGNRIFPESDRAQDVLDVLLKEVKNTGAKISYGQSVTEILKNEKSFLIKTDKGEFSTSQVILATGGLSYPTTGSTGDGYELAKKLGHRVIPTSPALVPLISSDSFIKDLQGLSLKNVSISLWANNKKHHELFGEALFTHKGLSGPIILDLSATAKNLLEDSPEIKAQIDFKPALDHEKLKNRILRDIQETPKKLIKNILQSLLPRKLVPLIVALCKIDDNKAAHQFSKTERKNLIRYLKEFPVTITDIGGYNQAIITKGGIDLKEVNPRTMESTIVPGLYFTGEILDLDGPTGGYNLQVCWSTGFVAGDAQ